MKKTKDIKILILISLFLLPISIRSFVVKNKNFFFNKEEPISEYSVTLTDADISLDLENYIIGVVAGEMPASFEIEALKAQAVASRSYALSGADGNKIHITSTINDQVYLTEEEMKEKWGDDFETYYERIAKAVRATGNEVIKRDGEILCTYYFAMSNGYTNDSQAVWGNDIFKSAESSWDNEDLRNFIFERDFTLSEILNALELSGESIQIGNITRHPTNYVNTIIVNNKEFTGIEFRSKLGLRSTDFTIEKNGDKYTIITRGYGHGVGMSQYGANGMAKEGYNYLEILKHYYNDIEITQS